MFENMKNNIYFDSMIIGLWNLFSLKYKLIIDIEYVKNNYLNFLSQKSR